MFKSLKKFITDLAMDPKDGRWSYTKIGAIIAGTIFSYKIIMMTAPSEEMMLVYMSTVGGLASLNKLITYKYGGGTAVTNSSKVTKDTEEGI